jgi:hypothetical protein
MYSMNSLRRYICTFGLIALSFTARAEEYPAPDFSTEQMQPVTDPNADPNSISQGDANGFDPNANGALQQNANSQWDGSGQTNNQPQDASAFDNNTSGVEDRQPSADQHNNANAQIYANGPNTPTPSTNNNVVLDANGNPINQNNIQQFDADGKPVAQNSYPPLDPNAKPYPVEDNMQLGTTGSPQSPPADGSPLTKMGEQIMPVPMAVKVEPAKQSEPEKAPPTTIVTVVSTTPAPEVPTLLELSKNSMPVHETQSAEVQKEFCGFMGHNECDINDFHITTKNMKNSVKAISGTNVRGDIALTFVYYPEELSPKEAMHFLKIGQGIDNLKENGIEKIQRAAFPKLKKDTALTAGVHWVGKLKDGKDLRVLFLKQKDRSSSYLLIFSGEKSASIQSDPFFTQLYQQIDIAAH